MVTPSDFDTGMAVYIDDTLYQILNYEHSRQARGGAFVRTELRNLDTGEVQEKTLSPDDNFKQAMLVKRPAQFLYKNQFYVFMDMETYDQVEISEETLGEKAQYLEEKMELELEYCDEQPIGIKLPGQVELTVSDTDPGVKGNTAQGGTKPAETVAGLVVDVPLFIEEDDKIIVNTESGEYKGKAGD